MSLRAACQWLLDRDMLWQGNPFSLIATLDIEKRAAMILRQPR